MNTIQDAINEFKRLIKNAVEENGLQGKQAVIRSSVPILLLHDAVKSELIKNNVDGSLIYPPLNQRTPELKIAGILKQKDQDLCVVSKLKNKKSEILTQGLLDGTYDEYGHEYTESTLIINVRSQISSIQKNFDTLYERTIFEAYNLHERCPNTVLGELYMIAIPEFDDQDAKDNKCSFKSNNVSIVEKYIKSFNAITNRRDKDDYSYKYEATCLLIVDFNQTPPKIYETTEELKTAGLLDRNSKVVYEGLNWDNFVPKLLSIHRERFGERHFTM